VTARSASHRAGIGAALLGVDGRLQRECRVIHVVAERLLDLSSLLRRLDADTAAAQIAGPPFSVAVRDFH
jgi:error-prone DNA polymerase